jgi:hypothetical protein
MLELLGSMPLHDGLDVDGFAHVPRDGRDVPALSGRAGAARNSLMCPIAVTSSSARVLSARPPETAEGSPFAIAP